MAIRKVRGTVNLRESAPTKKSESPWLKLMSHWFVRITKHLKDHLSHHDSLKMSLITLRLTKVSLHDLLEFFWWVIMTQFMSLEWVINFVRITTHLSHEVSHKTQNWCEVSQNVRECTNMDDDLRKVLVTVDTTFPITHTSRHYNFEYINHFYKYILEVKLRPTAVNSGPTL